MHEMVRCGLIPGITQTGMLIGSARDLFRTSRQLQHCRRLPRHQARQQHDLAVWKLKRVVMNVRLVDIDLSETSHLVRDLAQTAPVKQKEPESALEFDLAVERHLRSRKKTDRSIGLLDVCETACDRIPEFGRLQLVSNLCRTGCDAMHAVVAHVIAPSMVSPSQSGSDKAGASARVVRAIIGMASFDLNQRKRGIVHRDRSLRARYGQREKSDTATGPPFQGWQA